MSQYIVGLKIKSFQSFASVAKIIRKYKEYSFSEIKALIEKHDYLLCFDCADRQGVKKIIACHDELIAVGAEVNLYELDNRETTIEQMRNRDQTYNEISDEIDSENP